MDVSSEVEINDPSNPFTLRGQGDQAVAQAPPLVIEDETINYLVKAMEDGDRLPNTPASLGKRVRRRALIVAPQYAAHLPKYRPLPATIYDVYSVHRMLTQCGYDRADIRILVDGCPEPPTKDNMCESLKWLVSSTQAGDYRYFHFSGHGTHLPSSKGEGKEALRIPEPEQRGVKTHQADQIDHELEPPPNTQYTQVRSLQVDRKDIDYYNEAIVTSYKPLLMFGAKAENIAEHNMIRDSALNGYFSELPENSKLTCTLDTYSITRLDLNYEKIDPYIKLDNNFKLAGAGFRGRMFSNISQGQAPREPSKILTRVDDLIGQLSIQDTAIVDSPQHFAVEPITPVSPEDSFFLPGTSTSQSPPSIRGARTKTIVQNITSPPVISSVNTMKELLPAEEANRDNIKADMVMIILRPYTGKTEH
ncbi:Ca(2+)-dependent cysteine protease [Ceratobasidium sp. 428]|nr:Ca(2+)-dependent cysteine protease [Ceratobasidium sp. 428]